MNKKIKTILFTLFVAGLLTVSCSSKDKTGPSSDNGSGTTGLPIVTITDGEGIRESYRQYKYAPQSSPFVLTPSEGQAINLTSESDFALSTSQEDPSLQGENAGGILIKMPKLKELGFTSDLIRIPAKNIQHHTYGHDIHTLYVFSNTDEKLEYVELKVKNLKMDTFIEINTDGSIILTKTTKEKDKDAVTVTYKLTLDRTKNIQANANVTPIVGTPVDPNY
ncbi:hypothetical protein [Brachyspira pulli]|uniref:hypothetical protein n=1 Tax=Brachyspira pulli TaxID=310721 RepID=UPI003006DAE4